jgi:hypothetical protein
MYLAIVTFDLTHSPVRYDELRDWVVDKAMADYAALPGVRFKAWFSDELHRQWGAVYLVDDPTALRPDRLPRLPNGHTGPIGAQPTSIQWLELEAYVTGPEGLDALTDAGLSLRHKEKRRQPTWAGSAEEV